jgi:DNA primase
VRGNQSGEEKNLWKRDVICFDFDAKDFPNIEGADAHLKRIKGVLPQLFNHCTIASGSGGIHLYIAIKTTDDLDRVQQITKDLGEILSADPRTIKDAEFAPSKLSESQTQSSQICERIQE